MRYKGEMDDDMDDEMSEYDRKLSSQIDAELEGLGASGVPWEELPADLLDEATKAAEKIVGPRPTVDE